MSLFGPGALSAASALNKHWSAVTPRRMSRDLEFLLGALGLFLLLVCLPLLLSEMQGKMKPILLNTFASIYCNSSGPPMLTQGPWTANVSWYQKNQVQGAGKSGHCQVEVPLEMAEGTISLEVTTPPNCTLFLEPTTEKNEESHSGRLVCQCYPEDTYRTSVTSNHSASQDQAISRCNGTGAVIKSENAPFTSYLVINSSAKVLHCVVRHPSLSTPWTLIVTVPVGETNKTPMYTSRFMWLLAAVLIGLISLMISIGVFIWRRCCSGQPTPSSGTEEGTALTSVAVCRDDSAPSWVVHVHDSDPADTVDTGDADPSCVVCQDSSCLHIACTDDSNPSDVVDTEDSSPSCTGYVDGSSPPCAFNVDDSYPSRIV